MKYKPGYLVEIFHSLERDPKGKKIDKIDEKYLGKICLVISYDEVFSYYSVMPINEDITIEVYEEEIRLV